MCMCMLSTARSSQKLLKQIISITANNNNKTKNLAEFKFSKKCSHYSYFVIKIHLPRCFDNSQWLCLIIIHIIMIIKLPYDYQKQDGKTEMPYCFD